MSSGNIQAHWTEAVAAGDRGFVAGAEKANRFRKGFTTYNIGEDGEAGTWLIKEAGSSYMADFASESAF